MFSNGKKLDLDCVERRLGQALPTRFKFKTFICALSGTFHNISYERLLDGGGISIRGRHIHRRN
jgi:hypothetical protein